MDHLRFDPLDTSSCENEPIRYPGAVQPHGALLVVDPATSTIEAASESCKNLIGLDAQGLLGQSLHSVVGDVANLVLSTNNNHARQPLLHLTLNGQTFSARILRNATGQYVIDIEPSRSANAAHEQLLYDLRSGLEDMRRLTSSLEVCQAAAQLIAKLTGLDQVMIYRFDSEWNGQVIAEVNGPGVDSYLGIHFPASDIPKQARELFKECRVRLITDVHYTPSALIARSDKHAFDLGLSSLRSISPLHIQYVKNMGARATLVCALEVNDRLWGLVSCQQKKEPWYCSQAERDALGWLCQDIAAHLESRLQSEHIEREHSLATRRRTLINSVRALDFGELMRAGNNADLLGVVGSDGFALMVDNTIQTSGVTPSLERIRELNHRRQEAHPGVTPYASHALSHDLATGHDDAGVAGAMFVQVLRQPVVTMIWFRLERRSTLAWGGNPTQPHLADATGNLTPRTSFEKYIQEITGQSEAWLPEELQSASELVALVEIEALRSSEAFSKTILNSITEHISVLDEHGVIVTINEAWKQFAIDNEAPELARSSVGMSYRDICSAAVGQPNGDEAFAAWAGIESVLKRHAPSFSLEYPCDSPDRKRWFRMHVYPVKSMSGGAVVTHEDITNRKQASIQIEQLLDEQRAVLSSELVGIVKIRDRTIQWTNSALNQMLGYAEGELIGKPTRLLYPSERAYASWSQSGLVRLQSGQTVRQDIQFLRKDGRVGWYSLHTGPLRPGADEFIGMLSDINEHKQAQIAQRESLHRLLMISNRVPGMVYMYQVCPDGTSSLVYVSDAIEQVYQLTAREAQDDVSRIFALVHPDDLSEVRASTLRSTTELTLWNQEYRLKFPNGEVRWLLGNGMPQKEDDGRVTRYGFITDITERKAMEEELAAHRAEVQLGVSRQRLRDLVVQNEKTREQDRKEVAREVHDELGQVMAALRMNFMLMEMRYCAIDPGLSNLVADMKATLDRGIKVVRDVVTHLRPTALNLGLIVAIESLCAECSIPEQLEIVFSPSHQEVKLDEARLILVFRIVQESVTNILRYAQANRVEIDLKMESDLCVQIRDNGVGFNVAQGRQKNSFGLLGMQERAIALGGSLEIESTPLQGTTVRLVVPLVLELMKVIQ